ncbi:nucleotidyltransferase domain-containing protein [Lacihabitans sp. LS3-19]|uniref:nucleotidyltransferase domain-containing protein n=1 Tax=Lacihabitans sp. LS3-19 TaxID=2487335 RepID=UPI0020CF8A56|nr:nucleotidyltransferase domain-containing protein [Lacihabitans sp. LS3-19]MCP9770058.1 nucleotidyltransferase domain-containing protein [Lacihabitans sp. LS3-19]
MKEEILKELKRLEEQYEIKILFAVESGSRAWGFSSTDSDWDVRYIYVHKLDWYLKIDQLKDNQEEILENDIDLAGWELKKALKLFRKSNPPLLEWLRSPIVYKDEFSFFELLGEMSKEYFNSQSCMHHYLHMAEGNFKTYLQNDLVRIKKYFYVLRPILACDWIFNKNSVAPMEFQLLVESEVKEIEIKTIIKDLLSRKISGEELDIEPKIQVINDFLEAKIVFYSNYLKLNKNTSKPDTERLDMVFTKTLRMAWEK